MRDNQIDKGELRVNADQLRYRVLSIPLNHHGPGVLDRFDGPSEGCPDEEDAGLDGDIRTLDSFSALTDFVTKLLVEGVISVQTQKGLMTQLTSAEISAGRNNICAAVNALNQFVNQVTAQYENAQYTKEDID
jgi:hypothetical protein